MVAVLLDPDADPGIDTALLRLEGVCQQVDQDLFDPNPFAQDRKAVRDGGQMTEKISRLIGDSAVRKLIVVPDRLVNIVL